MFYSVSANDGKCTVHTVMLLLIPQTNFDLFIKGNHDSSVSFKFYQVQYTGAQSSKKKHEI